MNERPRLLHNMSAPPVNCIRHDGRVSKAPTLVFLLPDHGCSVPEILGQLDGADWAGTEEEGEDELRRRIQQRAVQLPYPAAVVAVQSKSRNVEWPTDLLTICTILAKSSEHVYLRDKEPNMTNIRAGHTVILQLPAQGNRP